MGEGIAVAFPRRGWLLVDSCRTAGPPREAVSLAQIWARWRTDPTDFVHAIVLTHPHEDHAEGFADLVQTVMPRWIGVAATPPPSKSLLDEFRQRSREIENGTRPPEEIRLSKHVRSALLAIADWQEVHPSHLLALHDGAKLPIARPRVVVRAPDSGLFREFLQSLGPALARRANDWSTVLELTHGKTRIVLGSDLPTTCGGQPVATGWDLVLTRHPHLGGHSGLKLPHHGSGEAWHDLLMTASTARRRAWWVTPKNASRLPRSDHARGLPALLARESSILLTALPASKAAQANWVHPAVVSVARMQSLTASMARKGSFLEGAEEIHPGSAIGPLDAVWATAFDAEGTIRGLWRGPAAVEVIA